MRVRCPIADAAERHPDRSALIAPEGSVTYAELDIAIAHAAARLTAHGLGEGSRVALYLPTSREYIVLLFALWRAGCTACPISTRLPASAVADAASQIAGDVLIVEEGAGEFPGKGLVPIRSLAGFVEAEPDGGPGGIDHDRHPPGTIDTEHPATILHTSGSTGKPKAALHTWGNHYFNALGSNENIRLGPGDRWLLSLPLYHVGGLGILFRCFTAGAAIVIPGAGEPLPIPLADPHVTHVSLVATQLFRLLRDGHVERLARLKAILLGGSSIPPALLDEAARHGLPVHTSYGLTEMASQVTTTRPGADRDDLRTSGFLLPHRDLRIEESGEILVRGATLFRGYVEGKVVHPATDAGGWYHTGDLGCLDEHGNLIVAGRKDNLFISGGENVQPEEIERALAELSGVLEAVVVPVPDPEFGQRPVAFVRMSNGAPEAGRLSAALRTVLPGFKVPVAFLELPEVGGDEQMKRDRSVLGRQAAEALGRFPG